MRRQGKKSIWLAAAAIAIAAAGCGEKEEPDLAALPSTTTATEGSGGTTATGGADHPPARPDGGSKPEGDSGSAQAAKVTEAYFHWIDNRRGAQLCTLLLPAAIDQLRLPVRRGDCARSLTASIGYRDPRGLPVFRGVTLREMRTRVDGANARVVATVSTSFADRPQPSIEDDIVYLRRAGGNWRVAKPSAVLYRAIGSEPPLRAITPQG
jgi:hypothetical protein